MRNTAISMRRKSERYVANPEGFEEVAVEVSASESAPEVLLAVVKALPEPQREVVLLRFVDGLALSEIATALEIPLGTVKSRLHNALATLEADPRTRSYFTE